MFDGDILRTPNVNCPACKNKRMHNKVEWAKYHPFAGHGYNKEQGWSYPRSKDEPVSLK